MLATVNKSRLNYSYEILEEATKYFHNSNKLGEGGSVSVYKVILSLLFWDFSFLEMKLTGTYLCQSREFCQIGSLLPLRGFSSIPDNVWIISSMKSIWSASQRHPSQKFCKAVGMEHHLPITKTLIITLKELPKTYENYGIINSFHSS